MLLVSHQSLTLLQLAVRVLLGTLLVLLLPLLAMLLSSEVRWGPADFVSAGLLLFTTIFGALLGWRYLPAGRWRLLVVLLLITSAFMLWVELAVGIFW